MKMTTGSNFEGYEIVDYLGIVNGQIALNSNFFKELSTNIVEMNTQESTAITNKLESASENAVENLMIAAEKKGANAIIGVGLNYTKFYNNAVGTVAFGTAVVIRKKEVKYQEIKTNLYVSNYYNEMIPRPVEVQLVGDGNDVKISTVFYNYNNNDIRAVRCDVELINFYDEKVMIQGIDFIFYKSNLIRLESVPMECKLSTKAIPFINDVKVYVKKFVTSKGIFAPENEPIDIKISKKGLERLKNKCGEDAVESFKSDGNTWLCHCGKINPSEELECPICGRKQDKISHNVGYHYDKLCENMKNLENVSAMKELLMSYIKDGKIESQYRMELLEIMESGLQYEKTKGDMRDSVLEKVIAVFEK